MQLRGDWSYGRRGVTVTTERQEKALVSPNISQSFSVCERRGHHWQEQNDLTLVSRCEVLEKAPKQADSASSVLLMDVTMQQTGHDETACEKLHVMYGYDVTWTTCHL